VWCQIGRLSSEASNPYMVFVLLALKIQVRNFSNFRGYRPMDPQCYRWPALLIDCATHCSSSGRKVSGLTPTVLCTLILDLPTADKAVGDKWPSITCWLNKAHHFPIMRTFTPLFALGKDWVTGKCSIAAGGAPSSSQ
jgi:hypothetical protein